MRAAAIAHSYVKAHVVEPFRDARVNVFRGNTLEPNDLPDVAMVFGGDCAVHRVLPSLAYSSTPLLVVPTGSTNDFARCLGIADSGEALRAWRRYLDCGDNVRRIDLGTVRPMAALEPDEGPSKRSHWNRLPLRTAKAALHHRPLPWGRSFCATTFNLPKRARSSIA